MKIWLTVATLFTLVNVAGGVWAANLSEGMHTGRGWNNGSPSSVLTFGLKSQDFAGI